MAAHGFLRPGFANSGSWGWIYEYECEDPNCYSHCKKNHRKWVQFRHCYSVEGCPRQSIMYSCHSHYPSLVLYRWTNSNNCAGEPKEVADTVLCYSTPFGVKKEQCANNEMRYRKWYKYQCYITYIGANWQAIGDVEEEEDPNVNIDIVLAIILLIVCLIGVIVGYLVHRRKKRKKLAERSLLLCEASSADNF